MSLFGQKTKNIWDDESLIKILKENGIVVMPTDTLYGIVGLANNPAVVEHIYRARQRVSYKPCIILIGHIDELQKFSIHVSEEQKNTIKKHWSFDSAQDKPEPVSIILDCPDDSLKHLHRGTRTLAFRLPSPISLQNLLLKTGPLIAPSANLEGLPPAQNIKEAMEYFANKVHFYLDAGTISGKVSKVIKLHKDGSVSIIRK